MSKSIFQTNSSQAIFLIIIVLSALLINGFAVEAAKEQISNEVSQTSKTTVAEAKSRTAQQKSQFLLILRLIWLEFFIKTCANKSFVKQCF